ncbi:hypothetical protein [Microbaculum marinum]|uniref:Uncharacterized protein n=1 Tax=Microbaculum marinum TaxID=1764581 RepID=A0AAW9RAD0_9HYPH
MSDTTSGQIRRRGDGSIDTGYYAGSGRSARSRAFHHLVGAAWGRMWRMCVGPADGDPSGVHQGAGDPAFRGGHLPDRR